MIEIIEDITNKNYRIVYGMDDNGFDIILYTTILNRKYNLICRYNSKEKHMFVSYYTGQEIRKLNKEEQGKHYKMLFDEIKEIIKNK